MMLRGKRGVSTGIEVEERERQGARQGMCQISGGNSASGNDSRNEARTLLFGTADQIFGCFGTQLTCMDQNPGYTG